jgi:hypothetical protein
MLRPYFGYKALVGLQNVENEETLNVYPNPTSSKLYIQGRLNAKKQILDISGRVLLCTDENEIDISNLNQGIYILQIENKKGNIETRKIVKVK